MGLERIGELRKQRKMTMEELSEKSGVPLSTVKKISAGITTNPSFDTVKALVDALGCSLDDLDDIKKTSDPEDTLPESEVRVQDRVAVLTDFFRKMGYIQTDGDISEETFRMFKALIDFWDSYFEK